jgi:hypothetical protein
MRSQRDGVVRWLPREEALDKTGEAGERKMKSASGSQKSASPGGADGAARESFIVKRPCHIRKVDILKGLRRPPIVDF